MSISQLIKTAFADVLTPEIWQEFKAGKFLTPDFKKNIQFGDEVNVTLDGMVTLSTYTGGDLNIANAEKATQTIVKVKINKGYSIIFYIDDTKLRQIENAKSNEERIKLVKQYSDDAKKQFARQVNLACCQQYLRAGNVISNSGSAITVSLTNVAQIFAKAMELLKKGDGKGHTAWVDGEMIACISPTMQAYMSSMNILQYSDEMAKHYKTGYIGNFMGFDIIVDNDIAKDGNGYEYPLFGRSGKTMAGGIQNDFEIKSDTPIGGFNEYYWGKGVFGIKTPVVYLLCSAKLNCTYSVGS